MSDEPVHASRSPISRRTVLAGMVTAGATAALGTTPASAATQVGFHPGHYFWAPRTRWSAANQADDFRILDGLSTNPYIKGIQIQVHWRFLEGPPGTTRRGSRSWTRTWTSSRHSPRRST